jgi:hypothetical protein
MIRFLSVMGRATIVIAAALIIIGFVVASYFDTGIRSELSAFSFGRELGALAGLVLGTIAAGVIFGPLATLYDIGDSLRRLVQIGESEFGPEPSKAADRLGPPTTRREPRLR